MVCVKNQFFHLTLLFPQICIITSAALFFLVCQKIILASIYTRHLTIKSQNNFKHVGHRTEAHKCIVSNNKVGVNSSDTCELLQGWTALHWAAARGNIKAVQMLLAHDADVTAIDNTVSPCHLC